MRVRRHVAATLVALIASLLQAPPASAAPDEWTCGPSRATNASKLHVRTCLEVWMEHGRIAKVQLSAYAINGYKKTVTPIASSRRFLNGSDEVREVTTSRVSVPPGETRRIISQSYLYAASSMRATFEVFDESSRLLSWSASVQQRGQELTWRL